MSRTRKKVSASLWQSDETSSITDEVADDQIENEDSNYNSLAEDGNLMPLASFMCETSNDMNICENAEETCDSFKESSNNLLHMLLSKTSEEEASPLIFNSDKCDVSKNRSPLMCPSLQVKNSGDYDQNVSEKMPLSVFDNDLSVRLENITSDTEITVQMTETDQFKDVYSDYVSSDNENCKSQKSLSSVFDYGDESSEYDWLTSEENIPNTSMDSFYTELKHNNSPEEDKEICENTTKNKLRSLSRTETAENLTLCTMQTKSWNPISEQNLLQNSEIYSVKNSETSASNLKTTLDNVFSPELCRKASQSEDYYVQDEENRQLFDVVSRLPECSSSERTAEKEENKNEQSVLSEPEGLILWALKNLLPNGKQLHDKASILHATADYIEQLHCEMKQNCQHLGIKEESLFHKIQQDMALCTQQQNKYMRKNKIKADENKVKRPANPFIRFSVEFRRMVANDFPGRNNKEVSQLLGSIWRRMSDDEKKPFITKFYADLHKTRRDYPDWNYSSKKGIQHLLDLSDMQPERLRPRNSKLQINYKKLFSRHSTKSKPKKKIMNVNSVANECQVHWVQCDSCNKWRKLPIEMEPTKLPDHWVCSMNADINHNSCDKDEENE